MTARSQKHTEIIANLLSIDRTVYTRSMRSHLDAFDSIPASVHTRIRGICTFIGSIVQIKSHLCEHAAFA